MVVVDHNVTDGYHLVAERVGDGICIELRPAGQPSGVQACGIPANAAWPSPVVARTVRLAGNRYVIGVASDHVVGIETDADPPQAFLLDTHMPFPTLQFFAELAPDSGAVVLRVATLADGVLTMAVDEQ